MNSLKECRTAIDAIDEKLITLLNERMEIVKEVGRIKNDDNATIYRPEREKEIIDRLTQLSRSSQGTLNKTAIEAIFLEIFAVSRNLERSERVAYLGPEGSFTHQAAESRFGAMGQYLSLGSIRSVFNTVESGRAKFGVVPIENSRDGVVGETLDLLAKNNVKIVAELYMPIHMAFATNESNIGDIRKVYSKDKGFGQCQEFLHEYSLENAEHIPVESTAKAAIMASKEPHSAAICSHIAAKLYGIPTLFENIEDVHSNKTRFFILSDFDNAQSPHDKTSIVVRLKDAHKSGVLFEFLKDFKESGINLSKIESRPSPEADFGYLFFIDFYGHYLDKQVQPVMQKHADEITWLGSYVRGEN